MVFSQGKSFSLIKKVLFKLKFNLCNFPPFPSLLLDTSMIPSLLPLEHMTAFSLLYVPKYINKMLILFSYFYVDDFRADHLALDSQLEVSSSGRPCLPFSAFIGCLEFFIKGGAPRVFPFHVKTSVHVVLFQVLISSHIAKVSWL